MKRAALGLEADKLADSLDLGSEGCERRFGLDSRPQSTRAALLESAHAGDAELERRRADLPERVGEIVRHRPLDFADEAQGEVQLLVVLPAEIGAFVHRVEEQVADGLRRPKSDEEPVHR